MHYFFFGILNSLLTIFLRDVLGCQILQNAMDALADPDNINKCIILWLEENEALPDNSCHQSTDQYIPLLQNFIKHSSSKPADMVHTLIQNFQFSIFYHLFHFSRCIQIYHPFSRRHLICISLCNF